MKKRIAEKVFKAADRVASYSRRTRVASWRIIQRRRRRYQKDWNTYISPAAWAAVCRIVSNVQPIARQEIDLEPTGIA